MSVVGKTETTKPVLSRYSLKRGFIEKGYLRIVVFVIENVADKFFRKAYLSMGCFSY
jgi:hypothetical protein